MPSTFLARLSSPRGLAFALIAAFAVIYVLPLGVRPMETPDETRYFEISREMLASGDWVSPRLNDVRYFEKPVLGYWLNSASIAVFGENAFALRLPSALATALCALMIYLLTLRFATGFAATLAAVIFCTSILIAGTGTFAVLDSFLCLFLTGSLASYYLALQQSARSRRLWYLAACGAFCAGAFLTKGFLALVIPVIVALPYLLLRRQFRNLLTTPWLPIAVAALLIAPWAILIHVREPDYWHYFFWIEHVQRFLSDDAQHMQPAWYFFVYGPFAAWPWSALAPAAVIGLTRLPQDRPFIGYLVAWFAMPLMFFSASNGKLLTYIIPCLVPSSILLAIGLGKYRASGRRLAFGIGAALVALGFVCLIVLVAVAQLGVFGQEFFPPSETAMRWALTACFAGGFAAALIAALSRPAPRSLAALAASGILLFLPLQLMLLPQWYKDTKSPSAFLAQELAITEDTVLVSEPSLVTAVNVAFGRNDIYMIQPGELDYGLSHPESRHRLLDAGGLEALLSTGRRIHEVVIICRERTEKTLPRELSQAAERKQRGDVLMLRFRSGH